jgi:methylmalonyl-CoA mutase N-terminal domain/subunit
MTNEIERHAMAYIEKIEALGGTLKAIEQGYVQQEIQNAAYDCQQAIDRLEQVVVGVNRFQTEGERSVPVFRVDEALERKQVERLRALRARRNKGVWQQAIQGVEEAARSGANLMPPIIHAVESCCTVGEISDAMRAVFGEYQETVVI